MNSLLIVDDEIEILQWLKDLFSYECDRELDVYTASSGRKAIELLNHMRFDVVLTDIKMPGMDGIKLYRHIRENWPMARVVFLTGYRDHETLYEIVKNREVRYVLKNEGDALILKTVTDAFKELEQTIREKNRQLQQARIVEKAIYWLQKERVEQILYRTLDKEPSQQMLDEVEIPIQADYPVLMFTARVGKKDNQNGQSFRIHAQVGEYIKEYMPPSLRVFYTFPDSDTLLLLIQPRILDEYTDWRKNFSIAKGALEYIQNGCEEQLRLILSFAVFRETAGMDRLAERYWECRGGLIRMGENEIPVILDMEEVEKWGRPSIDSRNIISKIPILSGFLEQRRKEEFYELLKNMTVPLLGVRSKNDTAALEVYFNISMMFLKYINIHQLNERLSFHIALYKLTRTDEHKDWTEAVQYLFDLSDALFLVLGSEEEDRTDLAMKRIESYIHTHIDSDLTLNRLAEVGGFNASYLSRVFKQTHACNLSEYITQERIKKARKYLSDTDLKILKVAEQVGYYSAHSFTRAFKTCTGLSPAEYRSRYRRTEI